MAETTTTRLQDEVKALLIQGSPLLLLDNDESCKLITEFFEIFHGFYGSDDSMMNLEQFRMRNKGVDDFFTQIEFNKYLMRCVERSDKVEYKSSLQFGQHHAWLKVIKRNKICLDAVVTLLKNAKEQFETFQRVSNDFKAKQGESPKQRSLIARTFNLGRESTYMNMTTGKGIPPSLYVTMLQFAYMMSLLETKLTAQCAKIYNNGAIVYNQHTSNISNIVDLYWDISAELLKKMGTNATLDDAYLSGINDFLNERIGAFVETLKPSSGGASRRRTRRRSRKSKSVRRKKRITKHRG